jgi:hypothetical protein
VRQPDGISITGISCSRPGPERTGNVFPLDSTSKTERGILVDGEISRSVNIAQAYKCLYRQPQRVVRLSLARKQTGEWQFPVLSRVLDWSRARRQGLLLIVGGTIQPHWIAIVRLIKKGQSSVNKVLSRYRPPVLLG